MSPRPRKTIDTSTYEGRVAERLKELRLKAKLSVEQAAEKLEITPTAIYGWEAAYHQPKIADLPRIAALYKVKKAREVLPAE